MLYDQNVQTTTPLQWVPWVLFHQQYCGQGVKLTSHLYLMPGYEWVGTDVPPLTLNAFMVASSLFLHVLLSSSPVYFATALSGEGVGRSLLPVSQTDITRVPLEAALSGNSLYILSFLFIRAPSITVIKEPHRHRHLSLVGLYKEGNGDVYYV
jgi:hypothetical protein